ncbi:MAG: Co2+/Mg2+ efflux protein ApaG [Gammaproteobacteria bacterium]|jgi:ApaG protein|nr:Co2+/Mg2+ efflux protein ApaG [Gammaproteobacteria bacterium]MBT3724983.1 Co2+/Mg2+ efflux protein ApaG [Gammaproteobacteria bacterium]MBT4194715.1 Co2+/Mg2+ efflux protein ApaG [Gammaproteobacteria bacterium]MBT4449695.1 Co2+/Mg2+ efflux protein ApaG [Gammaproteobacteria bacterium]MBT4863248.1 Co2+/Mg2+ efflux protein ApaG [Gammaproteobacteria bacterium]
MNNIQIDVVTQYIEDQSRPEQDYFVFAYTITILNRGDEPVKLLNRHWIITDSNQKIQEVRGEGVVGEQPYLKPGEQFAYTSGSVLETSVGTMQGSYELRTDDGSTFDAPINAFVLSTPRVLH